MAVNHPAIIVVAYNRPNSLKRLLKSLDRGHYPSESISLIISIDYSDTNQIVIDFANQYKWAYGEKEVITHSKNLGLRKHIIKCGNLSEKYGSIIVLEDDLYVSPNFYFYSTKALEFTNNQSNISGVSLYNHKINVHVGEYFSALEDGFDNWYFQFASSWGQAWTHNQWKSFISWYHDKEILEKDHLIPENVTNWSNRSWLKFFIAYMIETDKYFLYPKHSLSTNFNDPGTHVGSDSTAYQTELLFSKKTDYFFSTLEESKAVYDAFFESRRLHFTLDIDPVIDLYGYKTNTNKDFILSSKILPYRIINSYGRCLKPIEANIIEEIDGEELFLYDTQLKALPKKGITNLRHLEFRRIIYSIKLISLRSSLKVVLKLIASRVKNR
ncbi:glycosyltransferase [Sediminicola luteus]|uniref:Glycosyltransferase 2-like domain-containing protein n=1 Tax=Sediminicola luteus TaxID=319238 RepID=A0A2A4G4E4_9FLAO|nr:glycosyltransferase [Sediminicola luteus]PCE62605.1 hypothetical protein B7P33_18405 [Sediminicola luteus]